MSQRVDPPGPDAALRNFGRRLREVERQPGQWIYVGTSGPNISDESPPFQNGWDNAGDGFPDVSFYIDKRRRVHLRGAAIGGAIGTVIFTLPDGYTPEKSERYSCASDTDVPTTIQVDPNGDVTQVS